jgi:hypothetical protein
MKVPPPAEAQPQDPAAGLQIYKEDQPDAPHPQFTSPPEQPQPRQAPPAVVIAPPPAAAPTTPVGAAVPLRPAIAAQAAPAPKVVTPPPAPASKVVAAPAPPAPKPAPAPVAKAPVPAAKTPAASTPAPKASASGGAVVQIGAVSSTALADKAWSAAVAVAPGLAAGKGKSVEKIDKNGGVLYRTAVTGFASREAATAFCDKLKSAGKSCFVR